MADDGGRGRGDGPTRTVRATLHRMDPTTLEACAGTPAGPPHAASSPGSPGATTNTLTTSPASTALAEAGASSPPRGDDAGVTPCGIDLPSAAPLSELPGFVLGVLGKNSGGGDANGMRLWVCSSAQPHWTLMYCTPEGGAKNLRDKLRDMAMRRLATGEPLDGSPAQTLHVMAEERGADGKWLRQSEWSCMHCTFANEQGVGRCNICDLPRESPPFLRTASGASSSAASSFSPGGGGGGDGGGGRFGEHGASGVDDR